MGTLNVKIPDEMDGEIEGFLAENPYYLNKSELVRDAIRQLIVSNQSASSDAQDRALAKVLYESVSNRAQQDFAERGVERSEVQDAIQWARQSDQRQ